MDSSDRIRLDVIKAPALELLRWVVPHGVDEGAEVQVAVAELPRDPQHLAFQIVNLSRRET